MIGQSKFYKMYPISATYFRVEKEATPLLARQLIPHEIFLWLSNDISIFSDWLAALLGEEGVGSKEISLAIALIKREDIIAILNTLDGALVDAHEPVATEHGEAFYKWLKAGIESGEIAVNTDDALVQVVPEGVLIEEKLFKKYIDVFKVPVHLLVVYSQFGNLMGIVEKGPNDHLFRRLFGKAAVNFTSFTGGGLTQKGSSHEGILISDASRVFTHKEIPEASSALKSANQTPPPSHHQMPTENAVLQKVISSSPSSTSQ
ncbi:MAG: putative cytosolic protein [uncultured bacterium]|nr:MAG: putative cytosolic protein [uncultured bacterium]